MAEITSHRGVVVETLPEKIRVRVDDDCHCEGCAIVSICGTKNDDAIVTLDTPHTDMLTPGTFIEFEPATSSQWRSIFFAFIVPIIILMAVILIVAQYALSDLMGVLLGFGLICVYFAIYAILYRKGLLKPMKWTIRIITNQK